MADPTIPNKIFDATLKDQINFDKYGVGLNNQIQKLLKDTQEEVIAAIAKYDPTSPTMTKWKLSRLEDLNNQISEIVGGSYENIAKTTKQALNKIAGAQADNVVGSFNKSIGADIFNVTLDPGYTKAIVENTLIDGSKIGDWWSKQSEATKAKMTASMAAGTQALQIGMVQGESVGDLINRIRGTKTTPGVMSLTKREATALVRTSVMQVSNAVRQETYKANADVLDGFEVVATLDARTTPQCRSLDGKRYDMNFQPIGHGIPYPGGPPFHWNCRSTLAPIPKSFAALSGPNSPLDPEQIASLDNIPMGMRASMDGPVSANITYNDWLITQPVEVQQDILGNGRWKLWSENKLDMVDLVDNTGNPLSLKELQAKLGDILAQKEVALENLIKQKAIEAATFEDFTKEVNLIKKAEKGIVETPTTATPMKLDNNLFKAMDETLDVVGAYGDPIMSPMYAQRGADALPKVVNKVEMDNLIATGRPQMWRGVGSENFAKEYVSGELFPGTGVYGNGTYVASSSEGMSEFALKYAHQAGEQGVLRMTISPDAKIISYDDLMAELMANNKYLKMAKEMEDFSIDLILQKSAPGAAKGLTSPVAGITDFDQAKRAARCLEAIGKDAGRYALAEGYDVIGGISSMYGEVAVDEFVILNRGKVIVQGNTAIGISQAEKLAQVAIEQVTTDVTKLLKEKPLSQIFAEAKQTLAAEQAAKAEARLVKAINDPEKLVTFKEGQKLPPGLYDPIEGAVQAADDKAKTLYGKLKYEVDSELASPMETISGLKNSAGMIVLDEETGKVWIYSPKGQFGGYKNTFPKGTLEGIEKGVGPGIQEQAIREVFEETGLQAKPLYHLGDYQKTTSNTRYYIGVKTGGSPTMMGWEAEAVQLVPINKLDDLLNVAVDKKIAKEFVTEYNKALKLGDGDFKKGFQLLNLEKKAAVEYEELFKKYPSLANEVEKTVLASMDMTGMTQVQQTALLQANMEAVAKKNLEGWLAEQGTVANKVVTEFVGPLHGDQLFDNYYQVLAKIKKETESLKALLADEAKLNPDILVAKQKLLKDGIITVETDPLVAKNLISSEAQVQIKAFDDFVAALKPGSAEADSLDVMLNMNVITAETPASKKISLIKANAKGLEDGAKETLKKAHQVDLNHLKFQTPNWSQLSSYEKVQLYEGPLGKEIGEALTKLDSLMSQEQVVKIYSDNQNFLKPLKVQDLVKYLEDAIAKQPAADKWEQFVLSIKPGSAEAKAVKGLDLAGLNTEGKIALIKEKTDFLNMEASQKIENLLKGSPKGTKIFKELEKQVPNWGEMSSFEHMEYQKLYNTKGSLANDISNALKEFDDLSFTPEGKKALAWAEQQKMDLSNLPIQHKADWMKSSIAMKVEPVAEAGVINGKLWKDLTISEKGSLINIDNALGNALKANADDLKHVAAFWNDLETSLKSAYLDGWQKANAFIPKQLLGETEKALLKQVESVTVKKEIKGKLFKELTNSEKQIFLDFDDKIDNAIIPGQDEIKKFAKVWEGMDEDFKSKALKSWEKAIGKENIPSELLRKAEKKLLKQVIETPIKDIEGLTVDQANLFKSIDMYITQDIKFQDETAFVDVWNKLTPKFKKKSISVWEDAGHEVPAWMKKGIGPKSTVGPIVDGVQTEITQFGELMNPQTGEILVTKLKAKPLIQHFEQVKMTKQQVLQEFRAMKLDINQEDVAQDVWDLLSKTTKDNIINLASSKKSISDVLQEFLASEKTLGKPVPSVTPKYNITTYQQLKQVPSGSIENIAQLEALGISPDVMMSQANYIAELKFNPQLYSSLKIEKGKNPAWSWSDFFENKIVKVKKVAVEELSIERKALAELKAKGWNTVYPSDAAKMFDDLTPEVKQALFDKHAGKTIFEVMKNEVFGLEAQVVKPALTNIVKMGKTSYDLSIPEQATKFELQQKAHLNVYAKNMAANKAVTAAQSQAYDLLSEADKAVINQKIGKLQAKAGIVDTVTPAAEKKTALNFEDMVQYKGQEGSNKGGYYHDINNPAERYYIKTPANEAMAHNEMLAGKLYQAAGVEVPDLQFIDVNGKKSIASSVMDGVSKNKQALIDGTIRAGVYDNFVVDAWLADWDVVGLGYDNLLIKDGVRAVRIDVGGALEFRAQGLAKGLDFGDEVLELSSMRNANVNTQAAAVFKNVTQAELEAGVRKVLSVSDDEIRDLVLKYGNGASAERQALAEKLIARKRSIAKQFPKIEAEVKAIALPKDSFTRVTDQEYKKLGTSARINGINIPIDAEGIEDRRALLWIEKDTSGKQIGMVQMKLREETMAKMDSMMKDSAQQLHVYNPEAVHTPIMDALRGIAMQSRNAEGLRSKDIQRATEAITNWKKEYSALVKSGKYVESDLIALDNYYKSWLNVLQKVIDVGEGKVYKWALDANFRDTFKQFTKVIQEKAVKAAAKVPDEVAFVKKPGEILEKKISRGWAQRTGNTLKVYEYHMEAEVDGIKYYYWPNRNDISFAHRGLLRIEMPTGTKPDLEKALQILQDKIGVNTARATDEQLESLYLRQIAYARNEKRCYNLMEQADALSTEKERIDLYKKKISEFVGYDITQSSMYNYKGVANIYDVGKTNLMRPDLEGAAWEKVKRDYKFSHSLYISSENFAKQVLENGAEMTATADKLRKGFSWEGTSPGPDMKSGGANTIFMRFGRGRAGCELQWKGDLAARMDLTFYPGDYYGCFDDVYGRNHGWISGSQTMKEKRIANPENWVKDNVTEVVAKQSLSIFDPSFDKWVIKNSDERKVVLKLFRDHGYERWPDGRLLEDVIVANY